MTETVSAKSNAADMRRPANALRATRAGALLRLILDRPNARNALTLDMLRVVADQMASTTRDPDLYAVVVESAVDGVFSVGGDVREMRARAADGATAVALAIAQENDLFWRLECYPKPIVSLIDGPTMGSGVGLVHYGTHRVAGPRYRFQMPETAIGYFPDCGTCRTLARLPQHLGYYLALTGRAIGPADAYRLGLVTHVIAPRDWPEITAGLEQALPIDPLLDLRHEDPGAGELAALAPMIERCFAAPTVAEIVARLDADPDPRGPEMAADLKTKSPLALAVTHRWLGIAATLDLRNVLIREHALGTALALAPDFSEGVRALLIDKDRRPAWRPETLAAVTPEVIDAIVSARQPSSFDLPTRERMQALKGLPASVIE
jgi:enoyl-CoA hydratase